MKKFLNCTTRIISGLILLGALTITAVFAGGILRVGNGLEPWSLDPQRVQIDHEVAIVQDMFMGLTTTAPDGVTTIPGLAKSWTVSKDGKTYTFKLRRAKWSDGKAITAQDFVYTFRRAVDPKTAAPLVVNLYPNVKNAKAINQGKLPVTSLGIKALDAYTLQIVLSDPDPLFPNTLLQPIVYVVPEHVIKKYGDRWTKPENIVVSGPFTLDKWQSQSFIQLKKNPLFFDAKRVKLDGVIFYPIVDANSELARFRTGDLDITATIPSGQLQRMKALFGKQVKNFLIPATYYYVINSKNKKFSDIRVRKALSMAINRRIIVNKMLKGGQIPAYGLMPPMIENYVKASKKPHLPFKDIPYKKRLQIARRLMREAGYSARNPLKVVLKYNTSKAHKKIAIAISAMWKRIAVKTSLFNQEVTVHYQDLNKGNYEIGRAGWVADRKDPWGMILVLLDDEQNLSGYYTEKMLSLAKQARQTIDQKRRARIYARIEKMGLDAYYFIPLYYYTTSYLVSNRVVGYRIPGVLDEYLSLRQ